MVHITELNLFIEVHLKVFESYIDCNLFVFGKLVPKRGQKLAYNICIDVGVLKARESLDGLRANGELRKRTVLKGQQSTVDGSFSGNHLDQVIVAAYKLNLVVVWQVTALSNRSDLAKEEHVEERIGDERLPSDSIVQVEVSLLLEGVRF